MCWITTLTVLPLAYAIGLPFEIFYNKVIKEFLCVMHIQIGVIVTHESVIRKKQSWWFSLSITLLGDSKTICNFAPLSHK